MVQVPNTNKVRPYWILKATWHVRETQCGGRKKRASLRRSCRWGVFAYDGMYRSSALGLDPKKGAVSLLPIADSRDGPHLVRLIDKISIDTDFMYLR